VVDCATRGVAGGEGPGPGGRATDGSERPGDDFNRRGDVRAVLAQAGWTLAKPGENEYWRRPGKAAGWSASLKDRVFYVFSANAAPFEPNRAYSPFAVCALLVHGGDFERAASALRIAGYHELAKSRPPVPFIADDIMETFDDVRAEHAFGLLGDMAQKGQVIYLTHHQHLCDIALSACPGARLVDLRDLSSFGAESGRGKPDLFHLGPKAKQI
jgi:hypothetical protein